MADINELKSLMIDMQEDAVLALVGSIVESGGDAMKALELCQEAMDEVGQLFESGEYFLGDLIFAGEIMSEAVEILKPALGSGGTGGLGKLVICTVQGDVHDIGKNVVKSMLDAAGFEVIDLGVDVPPAKIVETVKAEGAKIVALSGVLTLALTAMDNTVKNFTEAGLRDSVKIIVGGNPVTAQSGAAVGADAWTNSPQEGVEICRAWA